LKASLNTSAWELWLKLQTVSLGKINICIKCCSELWHAVVLKAFCTILECFMSTWWRLSSCSRAILEKKSLS
jgi:hypothetical protein